MRLRSTLAVCTISIASLGAFPAIASAAASTTMQLKPGLTCQNTASAPNTSLGVASIEVSSTAAEPGFRTIQIRATVRLSPGDYTLWVATLTKDASGNIVGCSASPTNFSVTKTGGSTKVVGISTLYSGSYTLQVFVTRAGQFNEGLVSDPFVYMV